jgi:hypothetical protein
VEVTRAREATAAVEVTRVTVVLATETSAQETTVAQDITIVHIKDAEDPAALTEREARERVSRVEMENAATVASAREDAKKHCPKDRPL